MKQIFENLKTGEIELLDVPMPNVGKGRILVKNYYSLISSGTERTMLEFGSKGLLEKAKSRPDLVKQVLEKVKSEGLIITYKKAMQKLEDFLPLGYSSAGEVVSVGNEVNDVHIGDLVACAGIGYATHSEYVVVPKNLVVKIPKNVSTEDASFVALGSIAMQGVRQSGVSVGDAVAVIGLGLVGLIAIQILKSAGCKVIGLDVDARKKEIAKLLGVDLFIDLKNGEPVSEIMEFTKGYGVDAVLMTASTKSNGPVELVPKIIRDRGTFVIVGVSKIDIPRTPYYKKEITVKFSRSYGPGRYDPLYEEKGTDYPIGYVRWTEKRNMEAFLSLLAENKVNVKPLISYEFPLEKSGEEILQAISELIKQGMRNVYLTIITQAKTIPKKWRKWAEKHKENVTILEFNQSYLTLQKIYASSHLLLHPTLKDSFGLVVLEAIKSGLPIISTNLYAIPEMVYDGVNGFLTNPKIHYFTANGFPKERVWRKDRIIINHQLDEQLVKFIMERIVLLNKNRYLWLTMALNSWKIASEGPFSREQIYKSWVTLFSNLSRE